MDCLAAPSHADLLVKKSRFLACVEPCADRPQALLRVAELRAQHPGAAHVCWALLAGGHSAANDDGEPGGTAGRPMLEVLRHQQLDGVLATVVRYFGGIKLGAGGLTRAYAEAVARALHGAAREPRVSMAVVTAELPPGLEGLLRREVAAMGWSLSSASHGARVRLTWQASAEALPAFQQRLTNLTGARIVWL